MARTIRRVAAVRALWTALRQARRPDAPSIGAHLAALPRMLHQGFTGRYPYLDKRRVGMTLLGLVYVVSPVDVLPEMFLLVAGLGDDAVVLALLAGTILSETDAFLQWEADRSRTVAGETV